MRHFLLPLLVAVFFAASLSPANAQVPRMFSYQGVVINPTSGQFIPDGPHNILLNLYDALGASTPIFTENQTGVVIVKGIFNVMIGSVTPIPLTVAFDKGYFLGVSVDGGLEMAPRTALSPAPYAIHAMIADAVSPGAAGVVTSLNNQTGDVILKAGTGTIISNSGDTITINSTGTGGTGIQGVTNGDASIIVANQTGPIASTSVAIGGITTAKIADGAVTSAKIPANAVGSVQIAGLAVGTAQLADASVTPVKLNAAGSNNGQVLTSNGAGVSWQNALGGGLALPFSNTVNSASDLFSLTNSGTGIAIHGVHSAVIGTAEAVLGESNSTAIGAIAVHGVITSLAPGINTTGVRGDNQSTTGSGIGVWGSQAGSGWGVYGQTPDGIGIYGNATNSGTGVSGASTKGIAGSFSIATTASTSNALYAATAGTGGAGHFEVTNASPTVPALEVKTASTASTTIGIYSVISNSTTGASNVAAAIEGEHAGTNAIGAGVYGKHNGTGIGVDGAVYGNGGYGVYGGGYGVNSTGIYAIYAGGNPAGVALELNNGFIKVSGTSKSAFVHTTTAANLDPVNNNSTILAYSGMAQTDIVIVTHVFGAVRLNNGYGVWWNVPNGWEIFLENNPVGIMPNGEKFNVIVIKQ